MGKQICIYLNSEHETKEILRRIDYISKARGISRSKVFLAALREYVKVVKPAGKIGKKFKSEYAGII